MQFLQRHGLMALVFLLVFGVWLGYPGWSRVRSANLTSASVTLSSPRLSFYGRLNTGNIASNSVVVLSSHPSTAANAGSTTSANLFEGDTVLVDSVQYEVADPSSSGSAVFTIDALPSTPAVTALTTANDDADDRVIASRSATLTVSFTTVTGILGGKIRILVPDGTTSGSGNDGIPDRDGWDLTGPATETQNLDLNCTVNDGDGGTTHTATETITASQTIGSDTYHSFVCDYSDDPVIPAGSTITFVIQPSATGTSAGYNGIINPAPATSHSSGYADTYNILAQELDSGSTVVDQTSIGVAVIESVLVTATVPPQITFRILGQSSGATRCGNATSVTSTAVLVPFGDLLIDSFRYAAQELIVSTNAQNGYAVTALADNQLHRTDAACAGDATTGGCIPDATGDGTTSMSHTQKDLWAATSSKGFGYSLQSSNGSPTLAFVHSDSGGGAECDGSSGNCWKQFADNEAGESAQTIFSYTGPADSQSAYVCYKAIVSSSQQAGDDYTTGVTYRATATF